MIYVISDIHGEYDLFIKLLKHVNFSISDEMIVCGDIIDKGKNSVKLLNFIKSTPNIKCIMGNHEHDFLKKYNLILQQSPTDFNVVLKTLQTYIDGDGYLFDWDAVDYLESLPYYLERDNYICVHAGVPLNEQSEPIKLNLATNEQLVYDRRFKNPNLTLNTNKCIFFGHTPTSYLTNKPEIITYLKDGKNSFNITSYSRVHLDLGVWIDGRLGCFCIDNCQSYYVQKN